jgi:undecaprenyl-diphosphatase
MDYIHAIILGVVEGVTEFLPISSTGHLILAGKAMGVGESEFVKSFEIIIQLGAILAVVVLYYRKLMDWAALKKIAVAFLPTAVIGLAFYKLVKQYLLGSDTVVLWSLLIGGIALILFEGSWGSKGAEGSTGKEIGYKQAFIIGLFQSLAIVPGVSRAAATIVGGMALGVSRRNIVEFSFLLAIPTMIAASGLDLINSYQVFNSSNIPVLGVGFVTSFLVALLAIKYFIKYIQKHDFTAFGIYRVLIAIIFWLLV